MVKLVQTPYKGSKVVWRHRGPNITSLLTNALIPKEKNYSSSHLCYNVYSSRIIDNEVESCMKACSGADLGIRGPVVVQKYDSNGSGLEVLSLVREENGCDLGVSAENTNIKYCFERILTIDNVTEKEIKDLKLQTSYDYYENVNKGICVYLRSLNELVVLKLSVERVREGLNHIERKSLQNGQSVKYEVIMKSKVDHMIRSVLENNEYMIDRVKFDSDTSIYGIAASFYDYMEVSVLLSNRVIIRLSLNSGNEFKVLYNLNDCYKFEQEVIQCFSYGYDSNSYVVGGKCVYILELEEGVSLNCRLKRVYPNKDEDANKTPRGESECNTLKTMVSYTERLMKLQTLKNKNTSYLNVTGLAVHPLYPNILAFIESRSSKVVVIDLYQNSTVPLCEFSIPFTEALGNLTSRFRYIDWVLQRTSNADEGVAKTNSGIVLHCSTYPMIIYSLLTIEYSEHDVDDHFNIKVEFVRELGMSKWDIEQDRMYYYPLRTQLIESSIDYLDNIMDRYSIDDTFLSQYFHGYSGITVLSVRYEAIDELTACGKDSDSDKELILSAQPTSKHKLTCLIDENGFDEDAESLIFLALNSCGRVTEATLDFVYDHCDGKHERKSQEEEFSRYYDNNINGVYLCSELKDALMNLYVSMKSTSVECGYLKRRAFITYPNSISNASEQVNDELEVKSEQLTKRKYYNSKVYSGLDLINWLLEARECDVSEGYSGKLPSMQLPITNGFDYHKEFQAKPRILWSDDSILIGDDKKDQVVHIPSLVTQPFPLCSCRYFECKDEPESENGSFFEEVKKPVFDVVGSKEFEYNYTLEEYLSFVPKEEQKDRGTQIGECGIGPEKTAESADPGDGRLRLTKNLVSEMSDHVFCLPLLPVSREMANNYLENRHYVGGMTNDHKKRKWRISESCSRIRQPGCLLKHIIAVENEIENLSKVEKRFSERFVFSGDESWNESGNTPVCSNLSDLSCELDESNSQSSVSDVDCGDKLPNRGIYINKELIKSLIDFWDESCEYYGISEDKNDFNDDKKIDLLNDDLSQWHSYPYISFETIDSSISENEQTRLSLMSYFETQLSNA
ncbi:hypothetical protein FG386_002705 [Cryptosporidium ryanae]|uniref:uncharacterized protein n=1 Tax=Cryptosporidium ryanae TaxID=515981 RepID=UPI003519F5DE|nr:hypothetical protein FG386_002705 [Cryptosporidium ryanae]